MVLMEGLQEGALVEESGVFPVNIISPWFYKFIHHRRMKNRPVGGRSSETYSHIIIVRFIILLNERVPRN
jgi:hypothetical protein